MSDYTDTFTGYPIDFINADFYFLLESSHFVSPENALTKAAYLRVHFCFNIGGTGILQECTFCRFPEDIWSIFPLLAALRALGCWTSWNLYILTPMFCYCKMKVVTFIYYYVFTKNLLETTLQAYPNPNRFHNLHLKYVRIHAVRVITCLVLVVSKLSDATTKHILRWETSVCKVYVHEIFFHVSQAYTPSFYTALGTKSEKHAVAYTP